MAVDMKRSTKIAPLALSTSYLTGSACIGISMMTLKSLGREIPEGTLFRAMLVSRERVIENRGEGYGNVIPDRARAKLISAAFLHHRRPWLTAPITVASVAFAKLAWCLSLCWLSVLGSQGDAGQFRTPRHIIDFMVEVLAPQKSGTILDPASGNA